MTDRADLDPGELVRESAGNASAPDAGYPSPREAATDTEPLLWHFPPTVTAVAMLVACGCAARALYGHPSLGLIIVMVVVGVAALGIGLTTARLAFWVDDRGLFVRYIRQTQFVDWADLAGVGLADVRGSETIRILRHNGSAVDVPPSLLQPVLPVTKPRLTARLKVFVSQIAARSPAVHT